MNKAQFWLIGLAVLLAAGCRSVVPPGGKDPNFQEVVLGSNRPVLVDFYATWCGPCKTMNPIVKNLESEYGGKAVVYKVDIDEYPGTAREYRVTGVPTFLVFDGGESVERFVGVTDKSELAAAIDAALE